MCLAHWLSLLAGWICWVGFVCVWLFSLHAELVGWIVGVVVVWLQLVSLVGAAAGSSGLRVSLFALIVGVAHGMGWWVTGMGCAFE